MKIFVLNNTYLDIQNKEKKDIIFNYFNNYFIPFIKKYYKKGDIIVHTGNFFKKSDTINLKLFYKIKHLIFKISNIIPIYLLLNEKDNNDGYNFHNLLFINNLNKFKNLTIINNKLVINNIILLSDKNYINRIEDDKIIFSSNYIDSNIISEYKKSLFISGSSDNDKKIINNVIYPGMPYQFEKNSKKGIFIINDNKKYKFIENNYSPVYDTIEIKSIDDFKRLDKEYINNNKIDLKISESLTQSLKTQIILSEYNFKNIEYLKDENTVKKIKKTELFLDVEDLLKKEINNIGDINVKKEFLNILDIFKNRY